MVLRKIGLTGSTGMLGKHIVAALKAAQFEIVAVSRSNSLGNSRQWDLNEWKSLADLDFLFKNLDAIIHAGAIVDTSESANRGPMFNVNVRSCVNLGEWALVRKIPVIHISSAAVYLDSIEVNIKEEAEIGWSGIGGFYALTKFIAEEVFRQLRRRGLRCAIIRPSSLYGYGLPPNGLVMRFLATARAGGSIVLEEPVDDQVDLINATDVAEAIVKILKKRSWETFNLASGHPVTIAELARSCISATGRGTVTISKTEGCIRPPNTKFALNVERAIDRLGWKAKCNIRDGLQMILDERCSS